MAAIFPAEACAAVHVLWRLRVEAQSVADQAPLRGKHATTPCGSTGNAALAPDKIGIMGSYTQIRRFCGLRWKGHS